MLVLRVVGVGFECVKIAEFYRFAVEAAEFGKIPVLPKEGNLNVVPVFERGDFSASLKLSEEELADGKKISASEVIEIGIAEYLADSVLRRLGKSCGHNGFSHLLLFLAAELQQVEIRFGEAAAVYFVVFGREHKSGIVEEGCNAEQ